MKLDWGEHHCNECHRQGHCSIEMIARYYGAHEEDGPTLDKLLEQTDFDSLAKQTLIDSFIYKNGETEESLFFAIYTGIHLGYVLAKGQEPIKCSPEPEQQGVVEEAEDTDGRPPHIGPIHMG